MVGLSYRATELAAGPTLLLARGKSGDWLVPKDLEARGLVKRRAHAEDRRRAILQLTAKGRRIDRLQTGTVEASVREAMRTLPRRKIQVTEEVLTALAKQLAREHKDG